MYMFVDTLCVFSDILGIVERNDGDLQSSEQSICTQGLAKE